jgi:dCTP deaminase
MILNDSQIDHLAKHSGMITPYTPEQVRRVDGKAAISFGLSSFGYDVTLGNNVDVFVPLGDKPIDPKRFDRNHLKRLDVEKAPHGNGYVVTLPPHSYALGHTVEQFALPDDVLVVCLGKSTYARSGIIVNTTPAEPGWKGQLTLEFANPTPSPVFLYVGEGVAQFLFLRGERPATTYADRSGKYQDQMGVTPAKV